MTVIDAFTFNDELDLLECRLRTLDAHVDKFVLVESTRNFQGRSKELWYLDHRDRFAAWHDKIVHVPVYDGPEPGGDPGGVGSPLFMVRENHQRAAIARGLYDLRPADDAVVLVGDVDEIPNPEAFEEAAYHLASGERVVELLATTYVWAIDWRYPGPWRCTTAAHASHADPTGMREARGTGVPEIVGGSWHFTWQGGVEACWAKMNAFSHVEELARFPKHELAHSIRQGRDIHGVKLDRVEVDGSYPEPVQAGLLDHFLLDRLPWPPSQD